MASSMTKRISSYRAYLTTSNKQGDLSDLYVNQTASKSNSKQRINGSHQKTPTNRKRPVKGQLTNQSSTSNTLNATKSFVAGSRDPPKYTTKSSLQSHKLQPKILACENNLQFTYPTPTSIANDKENFIFRDDSSSPIKPKIIEGAAQRSRLLSARVSNIQSNLQLQPKGSQVFPHSPQQKLIELTKQQSYPRCSIKHQSFVTTNSEFSQHLHKKPLFFKAQDGSMTTRPQSRTTLNNLSSFADQLVHQKLVNRQRNESVSSINSQGMKSSMIKTFRRESGIYNNCRSSTVTTSSSRKQSKISSMTRKEKFKSYFRNYLNTNKDQQQSHTQLNRSTEKQSNTTLSNGIQNTISQICQKYSFADTQDSGMLLSNSINFYPQKTPKNQNVDHIRITVNKSGRASAVGNLFSKNQFPQPIEKRLSKCISSSNIKETHLLEHGGDKGAKQNVAILCEDKDTMVKHNRTDRAYSKTPMLSYQKQSYQTESKTVKKSFTSSHLYKPRAVRTALTQTMIVASRPESKNQMISPQQQKSSQLSKPNSIKQSLYPKKVFDLTKPIAYSNYTSQKKKMQAHQMKAKSPGYQTSTRSPEVKMNTQRELIVAQEESSPPHTRSKSTNIQDYTLGKKLGEGAYAVVHTAFNRKTNDKLAMKIYDKEKILSNESRKRSVSREIQLLKRLDHPNIVKLYESIDTRKSLNLIMEHVEGKSLYEYVKEKNYQGRFLPESEVKQIIKQLLTGVGFMHDKNIAHRDLKLDNILLIDSKKNRIECQEPFIIKIIDFGFSVTTEKPSKQFCGTPSYMAPEIVKKVEYDAKATDIWAIGILTYRMLYGVPPFRAASEKELYHKIIKGNFYFPSEDKNDMEKPLPINISKDAQDFMLKMLQYKQEDRQTAEQLLRHHWFLQRQ